MYSELGLENGQEIDMNKLKISKVQKDHRELFSCKIFGERGLKTYGK